MLKAPLWATERILIKTPNEFLTRSPAQLKEQERKQKPETIPGGSELPAVSLLHLLAFFFVAKMMTTRAAPKSHHVTTRLRGQHIDPTMPFGPEPDPSSPSIPFGFCANDISTILIFSLTWH